MAGGDKSAPHAKLIFLRHGQSEWNLKGLFTGWVDVDLSERGVAEGKQAGELIAKEGLTIDVAYCSVLKRAIKTMNFALEAADQLHVPTIKTFRLNERMYGGLQGKDKKKAVEKFGPEQIQIWRRSFDTPPEPLPKEDEFHPIKEAKYADLKLKEIPDTESLALTIDRVMPYWEETIVPDLKAGKTILVAAHGNSIRAILKVLEGISDEDITGLEVPTGVPLLYNLDADLKPIATDGALPPLKFGRYLLSAEEAKKRADEVKAQTR